ncbi:MAG: adenosylmethionine--8-amino-7-oxononanoate transaminase [Pirellulales bacterium]|nr:adenosylmethionine--8-amino-7-oxononanoate transaminase [Pirellulales bacterium]
MREPTRRELEAWDREHVWHAFTQMAEYEPCIFTHGHGSFLVDLDGCEYLDAVSSLWCNLHGHRHPRLDAALREQLDRVAHTTLLGASNPTTIKLARRLTEIAPAGLSHVFFSDDGATAVEVALKMAFQYWRQRPDPRPDKSIFVALAEGYHGDTLGSVSVGGVERFHHMFEPLLFETIRLPVPDSYRLPAGVTPETATDHFAQQIERVLAEHHARIAAVIVEPLVQAAAGMIMHPAGLLQRLRELTRRYDVLLIADEVAVGFGRTGTMFACEQEAVVPDFLCLAKGITGGYLPLAATLTSDEIWRAFLGTYAESKTFFHGHTYGGNPLGAAVALANLDIFEEERTLEQIQPKIARLGEHLASLALHPNVGDARQRGLIAGIELVKDRATKEPFPFAERRGAQVCAAAKKQGVYLRPLGDVLVVMPPLSISLDELDRIMLALERAIAEQFAR